MELTNDKDDRFMSKAKLINYLMLFLIIFTVIFSFLYYFIASPEQLLYSIVPVTIDKTKEPSYKFAIYGEGDHKIKRPMDIAIKSEKMFISDAEANKIWVFDSNGNYKYSFGKFGNGNGEFNFPYGISVDDRDRLLVADMKNHRIQVFNSEGNFLSYFPNNRDKDSFNSPGGLSIVNKFVYITDIYKNKIFVYDLEGNKIIEFGSNGKGKGQFKYPNGVTADNKGNIYVADSGNNRIQVFNKKGYFIREINGVTKNGRQENYASPRGVVIEKNLLFVVSNISSQIWVTDLNGQFFYYFGEYGDDNKKFALPYGIEINKNKLYIADYENHGVKVYGY